MLIKMEKELNGKITVSVCLSEWSKRMMKHCRRTKGTSI
jgi:hypothetical protein